MIYCKRCEHLLEKTVWLCLDCSSNFCDDCYTAEEKNELICKDCKKKKVYIEYDELEGKTISKIIVEYNMIAIAFTDGSYTGFEGETGYEGERDVIFKEPGDYVKMKLGILSKKDYEEKCEREERLRKERLKAEREDLYRKLRREFEK